jgi:hypothetical protein
MVFVVELLDRPWWARPVQVSEVQLLFAPSLFSNNFTLSHTSMSAVVLSATTPAMVFVVELLVLELVHHFFIGRNLFPPNVYKPLVGHRVLELGEDGEKSLGHYPRTPTAASDYVCGPLERHMVALCSAAFGLVSDLASA